MSQEIEAEIKSDNISNDNGYAFFCVNLTEPSSHFFIKIRDIPDYIMSELKNPTNGEILYHWFLMEGVEGSQKMVMIEKGLKFNGLIEEVFTIG